MMQVQCKSKTERAPISTMTSPRFPGGTVFIFEFGSVNDDPVWFSKEPALYGYGTFSVVTENPDKYRVGLTYSFSLDGL